MSFCTSGLQKGNLSLLNLQALHAWVIVTCTEIFVGNDPHFEFCVGDWLHAPLTSPNIIVTLILFSKPYYWGIVCHKGLHCMYIMTIIIMHVQLTSMQYRESPMSSVRLMLKILVDTSPPPLTIHSSYIHVHAVMCRMELALATINTLHFSIHSRLGRCSTNWATKTAQVAGLSLNVQLFSNVLSSHTYVYINVPYFGPWSSDIWFCSGLHYRKESQEAASSGKCNYDQNY